MQQFGLNIQSLEVQQNDVVRQNITLPQQGSNSVTSASTENNSAFCLSEDEKSQIEKVLLSMDKFGVSKDFYPKLSIVFANLPGWYLVKKSKHNLNKQYHLTKSPGEAPGYNVKELLKTGELTE